MKKYMSFACCVMRLKDHIPSAAIHIIGLFILSWLYALLEQIALPVPFSPVPILLQPLPLFCLSLIIGWPAVQAYGFFLLQGALGAPFFAHAFGGFARLMGPTGGYLLGMGLAAAYIAATRKIFVHSPIFLLIKLIIANILLYSIGLAWLSWFVPSHALLNAGFWPFMPGCFIKIAISILIMGFFVREK